MTMRFLFSCQIHRFSLFLFEEKSKWDFVYLFLQVEVLILNLRLQLVIVRVEQPFPVDKQVTITWIVCDRFGACVADRISWSYLPKGPEIVISNAVTVFFVLEPINDRTPVVDNSTSLVEKYFGHRS